MSTIDAAAPRAGRDAAGPTWIAPSWPVAAAVRGFVTTRAGGTSQPPYDALNLGYGAPDGPHDDAAAVDENRRLVQRHLPGAPAWLRQVHGAQVVRIDGSLRDVPAADAAVTRRLDQPLVVLVADCLPVLLAARDASVIGIAHAGWRGLAAGVVENTVAALQVAPASVCAWLGPSIGPSAFEVGDDVRDACVSGDAGAASAFVPRRAGKWLADLPALARRRLRRAGVTSIGGGDTCTVADPARFYSYRRDGATGRFGAFLWIAGAAPDHPAARRP